MKLLVEVVLLGVAASPIINIIPSPVLVSGSGHSLSQTMNTTNILKRGRLEDYGGDKEYSFGDYDDDYVGDYVNLNGGQGSASNVGERGRRGGFGVSSQFWGQVFHIHTHYHEQYGVNWDADGDEKETCKKAWEKGCSKSRPCCDPVYPCIRGVCRARPSACQTVTGKECNYQYPCCKSTHSCIRSKCRESCTAENASCAKINQCCDPEQKCINNKCTNVCTKFWEKGCSSGSKPCCGSVFKCQDDICKPPKECEPTWTKPCSDRYPCCSDEHRCQDDKCHVCGILGRPCRISEDCCAHAGIYHICVKGKCAHPKSVAAGAG